MPKDYDLTDILKAQSAAIQSRVHTSIPAIVESFDPVTKTISATPVVRNPIFDFDTGDPDSEDPVTIPNVKVCYPSGGGFTCYFPLEKGDHVLLVYSELATAQWRSTGNISEAVDVRRHSMGYPFAIPGVFPDIEVSRDPVTHPGKLIIGRIDDPTGQIRVSAGSVECGGAAPVPVALAAATKAALDLIVSTMVDALTAVGSGGAANGATGAAIITGAATDLTTAFTALAATITKGQ